MILNNRRESPISAYQHSVLDRLDRDTLTIEPDYMARWSDGAAANMNAVEKLRRWGLIAREGNEVRKAG